MNYISEIFTEVMQEQSERRDTAMMVDEKIWHDSQEFLDAILDVIAIVKNNFINNQFSGSILGEDLNSVLSKYGLLNRVDWYNENDKSVIILDYNFDVLDKNIRQGFNKYNLVDFNYLKNQLSVYDIDLSKTKKAKLIDDTIDGSKMLSLYTDKLIIKMPIVKRQAPRLKNTLKVRVRKITKPSN